MKRSKRITLSAAVLSFLLTAALVSPSFAQSTQGASARDHQRIGRHMPGPHPGFFRNRKDMRFQLKEVNEAIERGDYEAWAALMKDRPNAGTIVNPDTFNKLREIHSLLKEGDKDGARKIAEELGLKRFPDKKQLRDFFQQVRDAIKNNEYDTWAKLMNERPNPNMDVTPEAFIRLRQHMQSAKPQRQNPGHPKKKPFQKPEPHSSSSAPAIQ